MESNTYQPGRFAHLVTTYREFIFPLGLGVPFLILLTVAVIDGINVAGFAIFSVVAAILYLSLEAIVTRQRLFEKIKDDDTRAIARRKNAPSDMPLPSFWHLLQRRLLSLFLTGLAGVLLTGMALGLLHVFLTSATTLVDYIEEALSYEIMLLVFSVPAYFALGVIYKFQTVTEPLIDFHLRPHPTLQVYHYEEGHPLRGNQRQKTLFRLIGSGLKIMVLFVAVGFGGVFLASATGQVELEFPSLMTGIMLLTLAASPYLLYLTSQQIKPPAGSRQQHDDEPGAERFSVLDRANSLVMRYTFVILVLVLLPGIGLIWYASTQNVSNLVIAGIGIGSYALIGLAVVFIIPLLVQRSIKIPDFLQRIDDAIHAGDIPLASQYADEAMTRLDVLDGGAMMANIYMLIGQVDKAEMLARDTLEAQMDLQENQRRQMLPHTLYILGNILIEKGNYDAARVPLEKALNYDSSHHGARVGLAEAALYLNEPHTALPILDDLLPDDALNRPDDLEDDDLVTLVLKSWALAQAGQPRESARLLKAVLNQRDDMIIPQQAAIYYSAGLIFNTLNKPENARKAFQRTITLLPGSIIAINAKKQLQHM